MISLTHEPSPPVPPDDGIELLTDGGESSGGVFGSLLSLYEQQGYRQGYRRAVQDLLASVVWATEDFLSTGGPSADGVPMTPVDLRPLLYQFGQHLERHIQNLGTESGYVSDGLGI